MSRFLLDADYTDDNDAAADDAKAIAIPRVFSDNSRAKKVSFQGSLKVGIMW